MYRLLNPSRMVTCLLYVPITEKFLLSSLAKYEKVEFRLSVIYNILLTYKQNNISYNSEQRWFRRDVNDSTKAETMLNLARLLPEREGNISTQKFCLQMLNNNRSLVAEELGRDNYLCLFATLSVEPGDLEDTEQSRYINRCKDTLRTLSNVNIGNIAETRITLSNLLRELEDILKGLTITSDAFDTNATNTMFRMLKGLITYLENPNDVTDLTETLGLLDDIGKILTPEARSSLIFGITGRSEDPIGFRS